MKVYLSGSDMTERTLAMTNKPAEEILKLIKRIIAYFDIELNLQNLDEYNESPVIPLHNTEISYNKSTNSLKTPRSARNGNDKLIHYEFKTDVSAPPTRRLIDIQKYNEKTPPASKANKSELFLYTSNPNLVVYFFIRFVKL